MLTIEEVEAVASKMLLDYTKVCGCEDDNDMTNALFVLLISCSGGLRACTSKDNTLRYLDMMKETVNDAEADIEAFHKNKH